MNKETLGKTSGYEYQVMFEVVSEDVVTTDGIKLDSIYKGIDFYVKHNKVNSMSYKIFINDMDKYKEIVDGVRSITDDLKKKIDDLAQSLLNNFNWEVVVNEN